MAVPTQLSDLNATAASNSPASTDTLSTTDDYIRALSSIIARISAGTDVMGAPAASTLKSATGAAVGGATPGTGGIAFPATAVAVADANTLDDYEEGTWTPDQGAGLTVVGAFSSSGTYTKIGRCVTIIGSVAGATSVAVTAAGQISTNAPFTTGAKQSVGSATNGAVTSTAVCVITQGTTIITSATAIAATTQIVFTITYFI